MHLFRALPFGWIAASAIALLVAIAGVVLATGRDALGVERASGVAPTFNPSAVWKDCSAPTRLFNAGTRIGGATLNRVERVCSAPDPVVSRSAGGHIDPDSLHRSNFTTFLYGGCVAAPEAGCRVPLEIQVWPACERNPSSYTNSDASGSLGPDEVGPPEVLQTMTVRHAKVYVYGSGGQSASTKDDVVDRVEVTLGESTIVVFTDGSAGRAGELTRMLQVVGRLRPAGDSNAPNTKAASARGLADVALPAPATGAVSGTLTCNA